MPIPFDLNAARGREVGEEERATSLEDVLAGTRNVERVEIDDLVLVVRATTFAEQSQAEDAARSAAGALGLASVAADVAPRYLLARALLDPNALMLGERKPLLSVAELGGLPRRLVERLAKAHGAARLRAYPPLDEREIEALARRMKQHAAESPERLRAKHSALGEFFGLPPIELTWWQLAYYEALRR